MTEPDGVRGGFTQWSENRIGGVVAAEEEFDLFVRTHTRTLLRASWLLCGDWHAAEDLVQQALLEVWKRWTRVSAMSNRVGYTYRLLVTAHTRSRRRKSAHEIPAESLDEPASPPTDSDIILRHHTVAALRRLPPRQRAALVCRYFLDTSEQEAAYILNCRPGTVKSTTSSALAAMRRDAVYLAWLEKGEDNAHR